MPGPPTPRRESSATACTASMRASSLVPSRLASGDAVITHLNSALSQLNRVLVELGGQQIISSDEPKSDGALRAERMERRAQRRLGGGGGAAEKKLKTPLETGYFAPAEAIDVRTEWTRSPSNSGRTSSFR